MNGEETWKYCGSLHQSIYHGNWIAHEKFVPVVKDIMNNKMHKSYSKIQYRIETSKGNRVWGRGTNYCYVKPKETTKKDLRKPTCDCMRGRRSERAIEGGCKPLGPQRSEIIELHGAGPDWHSDQRNDINEAVEKPRFARHKFAVKRRSGDTQPGVFSLWLP